jgi:hypothetical protein
MNRLPGYVKNDLTEAHMDRTWTVLQEKFSFNIQGWKKDFRQYYSRQSERVTELQAFMEFGLKHIQPLLNKVLKRSDDHPTWHRLIEWVVRNN